MTVERDALVEAALAAARERRELRDGLRRASAEELERRAGVDRSERRRLAEKLLGAVGADLEAVWARGKQGADARRAFREGQQRALAERARGRAREAARRRLALAPTRLPRAPAPLETMVLDTALFIGPAGDQTFGPPHHTAHRVCAPDPPSAGHNLARAFVSMVSEPSLDFEIPPLAGFGVDFLFGFTAQADVRMNAVSFVVPNGAYWAETDWYGIVLDASAWVSFSAGLDVVVFAPDGSLAFVSNGTRDDGLERGAFTGVFGGTDVDAGPYDDVSEVLDYGLLEVGAGSHVFVSVWAYLDATSNGWANASVDFLSSDAYGIEVPGVFLATFPPA